MVYDHYHCLVSLKVASEGVAKRREEEGASGLPFGVLDLKVVYGENVELGM